MSVADAQDAELGAADADDAVLSLKPASRTLSRLSKQVDFLQCALDR